jgi:DNA polymerase III subunit beta
MSTITPAPRIGDVILIPAGACPEYRAAFRLRVTEILTRAGRGTLDRPIVGGTVVNANGSDRMLKGTPVERAATVDLAAVTVVTPAPATGAERRDADAEHAVRELARTRCDHAAGTPGCVHPECVGVPPVADATDTDGPAADTERLGESGLHTWARALRNAFAGYPGLGSVAMPDVTYRGQYTPGGVRRTGRTYSVAVAQVGGHTVHVIDWEADGYRPITSLVVDGVVVHADVADGHAMTTRERANLVSWRVADALRPATPVEPAAPAAPVAQVEPAAPAIKLADPAGRALATMAALTADVVHVGCLHGLKGAPRCHVTGADMPIMPRLVTCPECRAWLASESGRAWAGRWADTFARLAQTGYGCAGFTPRDGWPTMCAACNRPECAHTPALSAYPHNLGAIDAPAIESEATMSATVPATVAQVEPAAVPVVDAAPDVLAALLAGEPIPADALTPVEPAAPVEPVRLSVSVDRDALAAGLELAAWSAPRRPSVPVLSGVMITADADAGTVTLGSFDYEVFSINALPATVTAAGRVLVDVKALRDMVKKFPKVKRPTAAQVRKGVTLPAGAGMVTLTDTGSAVTVEYGSARASLPTLPAEDYPAIMLGTAAPVTVAQVDADILAATVARVTVAAGKDDTLPMLTAVQLTTDADGLRAHLAATDRYRLAVDAARWVPVVPDGAEPREHILPALIPAATLAYAAKWFGRTAGVVTVGMTYGTRSTMTGSGKTAKTVVTTIADSVTLTCGPVTIGTRTLDGDFPAVRALLPDTFVGTAQVDAHALADVVARVGMVAERSIPVRLTWHENEVIVAVGGEGSATASEILPASAADVVDGFTMGFNHTFLIDGLRAFPKGAAVRFGFVSAKTPAVLDSADTDGPDTFRYLIMPVRIGSGSDSAAPAAPVAAPVVEPAPVAVEPVAQVDADADAPAAPVAQVETGDAVPAGTLRKIRAALSAQGYTGHSVTARDGAITVKNARIDLDRLSGIMGRRYVAGETSHPAFGGHYTTYTPAVVDASAPVEPAAVVEPVAAPVAQVEPAAPVAVEPVAVPASVDLHGLTVERVAEILRTGTWSSASVRVGKGRESRPMAARVFTLNAGRLDYATEYKAVSSVLATLGGGWNRDTKGFAFAPSELVWNSTAAGARTAEPAAKVAAWLDRYAPIADAAPAAQVEPAAAPVVEPVAVAVEPVAQVDAVPAVVARALTLAVGDRVAVAGADGNGYPVQRRGYVKATPVDVGHRGVRVMLGESVEGAGRPVYVRDGSSVVTLAAETVAGTVDAAPAGGLHDAAERAAQVVHTAMNAGDFAGARVALGDVVRVAPAGYLIGRRFTVAQVAKIIDTAERAVAPAPAVEPVAAPVVEPVAIDADDADTLAAGQAAALAAMVAPVEPAAPASVVELDADGRLSFTLAPYAETVNAGRSYKASRKVIHAALRAARIMSAVVHAHADNRRGVLVACDAADRVRVAVIVRNTVTVVEPAAATV